MKLLLDYDMEVVIQLGGLTFDGVEEGELTSGGVGNKNWCGGRGESTGGEG